VQRLAAIGRLPFFPVASSRRIAAIWLPSIKPDFIGAIVTAYRLFSPPSILKGLLQAVFYRRHRSSNNRQLAPPYFVYIIHQAPFLRFLSPAHLKSKTDPPRALQAERQSLLSLFESGGPGAQRLQANLFDNCPAQDGTGLSFLCEELYQQVGKTVQSQW
jgi:hypothetical protein